MFIHVLIMVLYRGRKEGSDASVREIRGIECTTKQWAVLQLDVIIVLMDGQSIRKSKYKVKGSTEATVTSRVTLSCVRHHTVYSKRWKVRHRKGCH